MLCMGRLIQYNLSGCVLEKFTTKYFTFSSIKQLGAQFLLCCLFEFSTCFEQLCAHPQEGNCMNTTAGSNHSVLVAVWCSGQDVKLFYICLDFHVRHSLFFTF
jgi:hypothetical protein